jgi:hypothetical protein
MKSKKYFTPNFKKILEWNLNYINL